MQNLKTKKFESHKDFVADWYNQSLVTPGPRLLRENTPIIHTLGRSDTMTTSFESLTDDEYEVVGQGIDGCVQPNLKRSASLETEALEAELNSTLDEIDEEKVKGRQMKRFCITYNNPKCSAEDFEVFLDNKDELQGYIFQEEKGKDGTSHFQGYLEFNKKKTTGGVHNVLSPHKMAVFYANGTKGQNIDYCSKDDTRVSGPYIDKKNCCNNRTGAGKRNDLLKVAKEALAAGGITMNMVENHPDMVVKYGKGLKNLVAEERRLKALEKEKAFWVQQAEKEDAGELCEGQQQRELTLYFGPTAVGKTTRVKMEILGRKKEDLYTKNCADKWWCGYEAENNILMDEFKGDSFGSIEQFNAISNIGCQQVETKGGQTVLVAERMFFTTNRHPSHWWKKGADEHSNWLNDPRYQAVARRFKTVYWWNDDKELTVLNNPGDDISDPEWHNNWDKWAEFWKWKDSNRIEDLGVDNINPIGYFSLRPSLP